MRPPLWTRTIWTTSASSAASSDWSAFIPTFYFFYAFFLKCFRSFLSQIFFTDTSFNCSFSVFFMADSLTTGFLCHFTKELSANALHSKTWKVLIPKCSTHSNGSSIFRLFLIVQLFHIRYSRGLTNVFEIDLIPSAELKLKFYYL